MMALQSQLAKNTMNKNPEILFFDLENTPNLGYVWGKYKQNVLDFKQYSYILAVSYRMAGDKTAKVKTIRDFPLYKKDPHNDKELVKFIRDELINKADIVVAHNGDSFDIKVVNARLLFHNLALPKPFASVDTKKVARRYFRLPSNSLNDVAKYLGIGTKESNMGIQTWFDCMDGKESAWRTMIKYAKQDTNLLHDVYYALRPWHVSHPNINVYREQEHGCSRCGSYNVQRRGLAPPTRVGRRYRYQCKDCGAWTQGKSVKVTDMR